MAACASVSLSLLLAIASWFCLAQASTYDSGEPHRGPDPLHVCRCAESPPPQDVESSAGQTVLAFLQEVLEVGYSSWTWASSASSEMDSPSLDDLPLPSL
eukprot:5633149-Amphidinium_carterae.1